jgi:Fe2+ or Zn2+ uptake regulation protein
MKGLALTPYSVKELSSHIQIIGERQIYRELDRMAELGFVKRDNDIRYSSVDQEGNPYGTKHEITTYLLQTQGEFKLPSWEDIEKYVKAVNDVNDVKAVNDVNQQTEPLIKKRGKKLIDKIVNIDNDKS